MMVGRGKDDPCCEGASAPRGTREHHYHDTKPRACVPRDWGGPSEDRLVNPRSNILFACVRAKPNIVGDAPGAATIRRFARAGRSTCGSDETRQRVNPAGPAICPSDGLMSATGIPYCGDTAYVADGAAG